MVLFRALLVLHLIVFSLPLLAKTSIDLQQPGRSAKYFYWELYPKERLVLTFEAERICPNNSDKISITEFEAKKKYLSNENIQQNVDVRIKNLYVEAFSSCSNNPSGKIQHKLVIGPYPRLMTHVRVTASEGVSVNSSNDCGMVPAGGTFGKNCNIVPISPPTNN